MVSTAASSRPPGVGEREEGTEDPVSSPRAGSSRILVVRGFSWGRIDMVTLMCVGLKMPGSCKISTVSLRCVSSALPI